MLPTAAKVSQLHSALPIETCKNVTTHQFGGCLGCVLVKGTAARANNANSQVAMELLVGNLRSPCFATEQTSSLLR